jgi:uracil DNA glycosylase
MKVVSVVTNGSFKNEDQSEKLIRLLEDQLAHANEQNKALSQKLDQALDQIEFLNQQLQQLTKLLYGSKTEKSKYITPDGQGSLFEDEHPSSFSDSEHTEEQSQQEISYTVVRKLKKTRLPSWGCRDGDDSPPSGQHHLRLLPTSDD